MVKKLFVKIYDQETIHKYMVKKFVKIYGQETIRKDMVKKLFV